MAITWHCLPSLDGKKHVMVQVLLSNGIQHQTVYAQYTVYAQQYTVYAQQQ